ncbi:muts domain V-domain-containing protein [Gorgonomyces haynaldii]|nr:muts domain V-domain-containing protein [Gorgonomyces haynaldii]
MSNKENMPKKKKQMTLTSFFKSPKQNLSNQESPKQRESRDSDDEEIIPRSAKKTRVIEDMDVDPVTPSKSLQKFMSSPNKTPKSDPSRNRQSPVADSSRLTKTPMTDSSSFTERSTPRSTSEKKQQRNKEFKERNEERYQWLLNIKDAQMRSSDDPEYDPRTLHIPMQAWNKMTPFERQFWEIKSKHWDMVVFFKKGKFYELYEKDADIGHQIFDLKMVDRVNMRMVGVPESSFEHWASQFIAKGYKVAKVEQMENSVGKAIRERESNQNDKIVRRELSSVLTAGTLIDGGLLTNDLSTFCMCLKESIDNGQKFGICFVDTATAEFHVTFFEDDQDRTKLETLLVQLKPRELVLEKKQVTKRTMKLIKNTLEQVQINWLVPETEFWNDERTKDEIRRGQYFEQWPETLENLKDREALCAVGGLMHYLKTLKIDHDLISARNFSIYDPVKKASSLVLDGQTLINLDVFENADGNDNGTLFKLLDHCRSPFGKRMFKKWMCHPLRSVPAINDRLDAIDDLYEITGHIEDTKLRLRKLPDMERIIARVHTKSCKPKDFVLLLESIRKAESLLKDLKVYASDFKSKRLAKLCNYEFSQDLKSHLEYFEECFDHQEATSNDKIRLLPGHDAEFDQLQQKVDKIDCKLQEHLKECQAQIKAKNVQYKDMGKEIYQIEVSNTVKVPNNWQIMSKTQSVNRYWNPTVRQLVNEIVEAKEECEEAMRNIKTKIYTKFDEYFKQWNDFIKIIAEIDCLLSLLTCREQMAEPICRPVFVDEDGVFEAQDLRHPLFTKDCIPNDLELSKEARMILLTGPNMGGKSTLLRQVCIAVMMAQLGSYVPASSLKMSVFDRIFTRIGASDNIMAGQSTFMVELTETCKILKEATPSSLVILDELGRGTSTFDGYAIAFAVLYHLIVQTQCLGLFSTHYRNLTQDFDKIRLVKKMFMSYHIHDDTLTFLYKLKQGTCPQSYGMNVAKMAGIPAEIVERAQEIADQFDQDQNQHKQDDGLLELETFKLLQSKLTDTQLHTIWSMLQQ